MLNCAAHSKCAGNKTQIGQPNPEVFKPPRLLSKPISKPNRRTSHLASHAPPAKATERYCSKNVDTLLHEVCVKLEEVKEDRVLMQQLARIEHIINGSTNFRELKLLQWYDFSGCTKKYAIYS